MPNHVRVHRGRVKVGDSNRVKKTHTKTAGKLTLYGSGMEPETNLNKLRSSLKAMSISGKKPKYISF
jgi:hypothetical protein